MECGARFLGGRVISSFDIRHGDTRLSRASVERSRMRLEGWRSSLAAVVDRALADGTPMTPGRAMDLAGIPASANLRARRLGLSLLAARLAGGGDPVPRRTPPRPDGSMLTWRTALRPAQFRAFATRAGWFALEPAAPPAAKRRHRA